MISSLVFIWLVAFGIILWTVIEVKKTEKLRIQRRIDKMRREQEEIRRRYHK